MTSIAEALKQASDTLSSVTDTPQLEAEILMVSVLRVSRSHLHAFAEKQLKSEELRVFREYLQRRLQNEPIAYITGEKEFWSLNLLVNEKTLIPRPDTEILVETALALFPDNEQIIRVADLGTGSGAIALAIAHERPHWEVCAVDISNDALEVASNNAQRLGIDNISFYAGSWFTALPSQQFDMVVSNPPYVSLQEWQQYEEGLKFEPRLALLSGKDGLDAINEICRMASQYIRPGGYLLIEHGYAQGSAVRAIFKAAGCNHVRTIQDLSSQERVTLGQL